MINILQIINILSTKYHQKSNIGFLSSLLTFIVYKYLPLINLTIALISTFKCSFKWINCFLQQMPFYTQVIIALINFFKVKYPLPNKNIHYLGILSFICERIRQVMPEADRIISFRNNKSVMKPSNYESKRFDDRRRR